MTNTIHVFNSDELHLLIKNIVKMTLAEVSQKQAVKDKLTYKEAAEFLSLKVATVRKRANDGIYNKYYQKAGGHPYLSRKEISAGFE